MNTSTIPAKEWNAMKGKMEDTSLPEWQEYYRENEKWRDSRGNYSSEMDWWMDKPNKPGYVKASND